MLKSSLTFIYLTFFAPLSFSQSWEELNKQVTDLYDKGEFIKAIPFAQRAVAIIKNDSGEYNSSYAKSLNTLGLVYYQNREYIKAEPFFFQAKEIIKKVLGENHTYYATSLNNLASLYMDMGYFEKAGPLFLQAKEVSKNIVGENHPDYAKSLESLATFYKNLFQYEKAEPLYVQAVEIYKNFKKEIDPDYVSCLNALAELYQNLGQYEKATVIYDKIIGLKKKLLGESHPDFAIALTNIALDYISMYQYEKAEPLLIQAKEIRLRLLGTGHPDYITSLSNLARLYSDMNKSDKVIPLFIQTIDLCRDSLKWHFSGYPLLLHNMAWLYNDVGQNELAEPLFLSAVEAEKSKGGNNPDYAESLSQLADFYINTGQYEKAESLLITAKETYKNIFGETNTLYAESINNLADFYRNSSQFEKAEQLTILKDRINFQNLNRVLAFLSEKEKNNYIEHNNSIIESNNSFLYNYKNASFSSIKNSFDFLINLKSLSLNSSRSVLESVRNNKDSVIRIIFNKWQNNKIFLSKQYALPITNRIAELDSIEDETEKQEKELTRISSKFKAQKFSQQISMQQIQNNLKEDEVAVEFVRFRLYNNKWTDSVIYAAYIVRKYYSVPQFIPLCEEGQLELFFAKTGANENIKTIYRSTIDEVGENKIQLGDSLYNLVWRPLIPYLNGIKKIDYSPAGLLYKVAFQALPAGNNQLLLDKYEMNQYISIRQIAVSEEEQSNPNNSIALFGNCAFTMDSATITNGSPANENTSNIFSSSISRGNKTEAWRSLPGTANEIKNIQSLFEKNKISTVSYTEQQALEEKFKSLSGLSPSIIHLATHGFFLPDPEKKKKEGLSLDDRNPFTLADEPLLRSGIILSGANRVWGGLPPIEGREDGIVTAYEISQMDLSNTQLIVLSACETALGDIKGNEGVFGLQRAFKLAGVKSMILSLWRVPDNETAELMTDFYSYYLQGKSVREAFNAAQKNMRAKYKPYYWAAFVLIE